MNQAKQTWNKNGKLPIIKKTDLFFAETLQFRNAKWLA